MNQLNIEIKKGATFKQQFTLYTDTLATVPLDMTDYTARMQIRESVESEVLIDLTTENGGITIDGIAGIMLLMITDEATAAVDARNGVYDLELYVPDGTVISPFGGNIRFIDEITREP